MRMLIALILAVILPTMALAEFSSATFDPYSSQTDFSCSVMAGSYDGKVFTPNPSTSSLLRIGHNPKTIHCFGNASSVLVNRTYTPTGADTHLKITCYPTLTGPTNARTTTKTVTLSSYTSLGGFRSQASTETIGADYKTVKMFLDASTTVYFPITDEFLKIK